MTRLYVVHVASEYTQSIHQRYANGDDARHAVRLACTGSGFRKDDVVAVVVQGTGERVPKDLWQ